MFKRYQHLERFGTTEVENIELGECYIFPKIDGTNGSVWMDNGEIKAGSRNRELSLEKDNAGFLEWAKGQKHLISYLNENPNHRLFGEWLVPHSLTTYRGNAWRNFYVFDVEIDSSSESDTVYMHYNDYKPLLDKHGVDYIPPIAIIKNAS